MEFQNSDTIQVIKIGGNVIDAPSQLNGFLEQFHSIASPKVLVHGGGKVASAIGGQMGIVPKMHEGRRITDAATLDLVTMVYAGLVNKKIVAQLSAMGCPALGLSGADADLIRARKRPSQPIDFGWVGDVTSVNGDRLLSLLKLGFCPVICPITHNAQGQLLNTNADTIAAQVALGLASLAKEVELVYCFEKEGVLADPEDESSCIAQMDKNLYLALREQGAIHAGMLPKLQNCFEALERGVRTVRVLNSAKVWEALQPGAQIGTVMRL